MTPGGRTSGCHWRKSLFYCSIVLRYNCHLSISVWGKPQTKTLNALFSNGTQNRYHNWISPQLINLFTAFMALELVKVNEPLGKFYGEISFYEVQMKHFMMSLIWAFIMTDSKVVVNMTRPHKCCLPRLNTVTILHFGMPSPPGVLSSPVNGLSGSQFEALGKQPNFLLLCKRNLRFPLILFMACLLNYLRRENCRRTTHDAYE